MRPMRNAVAFPDDRTTPHCLRPRVIHPPLCHREMVSRQKTRDDESPRNTRADTHSETYPDTADKGPQPDHSLASQRTSGPAADDSRGRRPHPAHHLQPPTGSPGDRPPPAAHCRCRAQAEGAAGHKPEPHSQRSKGTPPSQRAQEAGKSQQNVQHVQPSIEA